jgi:predicted nucleic acid-binding Zn ribbon protein
MRFKDEKELKDLISSFVDQGALKHKLLEARLIEMWPKWVGDPIAKYTEKISVHKGQLILQISSPALRNELGFQRHKIIELVNKELNHPLIEEVIIR